MLVRDHYCWDGGVVNVSIIFLFVECVCIFLVFST